MDLSLGIALRYYKRRDVQEALVSFTENKEVAVRYGKEGGYGKRPDSLRYPNDVIAMVQNGATSFHISEELWSNPMQLAPQMKRQEQDELRIGWDLILDIDCPVLEYSQIAADLLYGALVYQGISCVTIKFSGNHGFHLAVPFEAFPEEIAGQQTNLLFPEGPRRIAEYLKDMIASHLRDKLLAYRPAGEIASSLGKSESALMTDGRFDPFKVLVIDTVLISSRHLYRMPYSLNEKSGLISIPIDPKEILTFTKDSAKPDNVVVGKHPFLVRDGIERGCARKLLVSSFDFKLPKEKEQRQYAKRDVEIPSIAIPIELFPPCILNILKGLPDGKKRAMFILTNFLQSVGWSHDMIEQFLENWNRQNPDPIREVILKGHLNHARGKSSGIMPPSCENDQYYKDLHICSPDSLCKRIKNPAQYTLRRKWMIDMNNQKERAKNSDYIETN